uniref:Uncharacterized protein n=1 Tax=viral metagenome TaxID=1070528 RepID=A0A6M3KEP8_9ZZZZ
MATDPRLVTAGGNMPTGNAAIDYLYGTYVGSQYHGGPVQPSTPEAGYKMSSPGYAGVKPTQPAQAMQWVPQSVKSSTATATRTIGALPELPEYEEIDEEKLKSRTQELSALGRREARTSFQNLLSRIYGATPDDPYAQNLARIASGGFSMDVQRAISAGGKEALSIGLSEQQQRNQRRMTAYSAAVNAVLSGGTTTTTQTYEYAPTPMQALPTAGMYREPTAALSTRYDPNKPLSLGQPYTYG